MTEEQNTSFDRDKVGQNDTAEKDMMGNDTAENNTAENDTAENDTAENDTAENDAAENDAAENDTAGNDIAGNDIAENVTAENDMAEKDTELMDAESCDMVSDAAETGENDGAHSCEAACADEKDTDPEAEDTDTEAEAADLEDEEACDDEEAADLENEDVCENIDSDSDIEDEEESPKKNRWTWVSTVVVIAAALAVAAVLCFAFRDSIKSSWEGSALETLWDKVRPKVKSSADIGDYSTIEIAKADIEVPQESIENYITSLLNGEELTDEWVEDYALTHSDVDASNVEEFRAYIEDYAYKTYLHNAIMNYMISITTVNTYDELVEADLIEYAAQNLENYAAAYSVDADTLASYYGYESALAYEQEIAHNYMQTIIILDKVLKDKDITYTDEDVDNDLQEYLTENGNLQTLEEYKETVGDTWCYLYENLTFKYNLATTALEENVKLTE